MKILAQSDRAWLAFTGAGFSFAVIIGVMAYVGYRGDLWLGTSPWLLVLGALAGVAVATWDLLRTVSALERRQKGTDG